MAFKMPALAPFMPIGMIGVLALVVVIARLPDNSALRAELTGAATDGCAVDAVEVECRCVVRDEKECKKMGGTFYSRTKVNAAGLGGIDACLAVCAAGE